MHSPHVNEILCFFHESLIAFSASGLCVNVLFISLERYGSVASLMFQPGKNPKVFVMIIWIVATVGFVLPWINLAFKTTNIAEVIKAEENKSLIDCEHLITSYNEYNIYEIYAIGIFGLSFTGIVFCYVGIYRIAKKRLKLKGDNGGTSKLQSVSKQQQEKRAFKVTVSIVGCFLFCWSLFITVSLIEMVVPPSTAVNGTHLVSLTVVFLSTVIHPILYRFIHGDIKRIFQRRTDTTENSLSFTKSNAVGPNTKQRTLVESIEPDSMISNPTTTYHTDKPPTIENNSSLQVPTEHIPSLRLQTTNIGEKDTIFISSA
ncbi:unnamed protein product [Mytilus coruscus]|uniref:G-protein coupled receptors family 1 profile domain-containing protein n=1 Tax=Mytilus coruscus TaxID=42192 RepID=A0A6J8EC40_MYTCO|nr:unnamed protein product [Mytilus coruscus]